MIMSDISSQEVGNYFLSLSEEDNIPISNLKLQKLVYIAYGFYASLENEKLFDERIEAWQHGPVIPSLYHEAKHYGSRAIISPFTTIEELLSEISDLDDMEVDVSSPALDEKNKFCGDVIKLVWDKYKEYTAWTLRGLTHLEGTPWHDVYEIDKNNRGEIPFEKIKLYYDDFIKNLIKEQ